MSNNNEKRTVGVVFGIVILFVPYLAAWFTLRKGYSKTARWVSLCYMLIVITVLQIKPGENAKIALKSAIVGNDVSLFKEVIQDIGGNFPSGYRYVEGEPILYYSVRNKAENIVEYLLEHDVVNKVVHDNKGYNAYFLALESGDQKMLSVFEKSNKLNIGELDFEYATLQERKKADLAIKDGSAISYEKNVYYRQNIQLNTTLKCFTEFIGSGPNPKKFQTYYTFSNYGGRGALRTVVSGPMVNTVNDESLVEYNSDTSAYYWVNKSGRLFAHKKLGYVLQISDLKRGGDFIAKCTSYYS